VVNPILEDQKYLFTLTNIKKIINIAKIRTNSHGLHSETRLGNPQKIIARKTLSPRVIAYIHIRSKF
jgi:hypothetical protein